MSGANTPAALARLRRAVLVALAFSALVYLGSAAYNGWSETADSLATFRWMWLLPILLSTLANYLLRWLKWRWILAGLGVRLPILLDLQIYAVGLMMTLSPGKAGELVKPWYVWRANGTPVSVTVPALVVDRLTDALAVLSLAALGAVTYASDQLPVLLAALGVLAVGTLLLASRPASALGLSVLEKIPGVRRLEPVLRTSVRALHTSLSVRSLGVCLALSLVAWWSECVGTWLVFRAFGAEMSLGTATFLYALATALGAISPGGVGVTDATLISGAQRLISGMTLGTATAAAFILRVATLWFGVVLGAIAMVTIESQLDPTSDEPTS